MHKGTFMATVSELQAALDQAIADKAAFKSRYDEVTDRIQAARVNGTVTPELRAEKEEVNRQYQILASNAVRAQQALDAGQRAERAESTIKSPEATNESKSDADTAKKNEDGTRVPDPGATQAGDPKKVVSREVDDEGNVTTVDANGKREVRDASGKVIPMGGGRVETPATAQWAGARDLRVLLRIPPEYLLSSRSLRDVQGILFPYTPSIGYESKANYSPVNPMHSNYTQYSFKNSEVTNISLTAKLSVQNEQEAVWWLAIQHVLRSLTKMRWGADQNAGAPPPVCRLEGYGDFMLRNIPVAVGSFKIDLPDNIDYISTRESNYKTSLVPTISTLSLTLIPMYSRREIRDYSVDKWLSRELKGKGYL
jgi:hypothetical protein